MHCWLLLTIWLLIGVLANVPLGPTGAEANSPDHYLSQLLEEYGEFYGGAGWPFTYLLTTYRRSATTVINQWTVGFLIINCSLIAVNLIFLVATLQFWMRRFSMRTFLISIAIVAFVVNITIVLLKNADSFEKAEAFERYIIALYFSPILVGFGLGIYSLWLRSRDNNALDRSR